MVSQAAQDILVAKEGPVINRESERAFLQMFLLAILPNSYEHYALINGAQKMQEADRYPIGSCVPEPSGRTIGEGGVSRLDELIASRVEGPGYTIHYQEDGHDKKIALGREPVAPDVLIPLLRRAGNNTIEAANGRDSMSTSISKLQVLTNAYRLHAVPLLNQGVRLDPEVAKALQLIGTQLNTFASNLERPSRQLITAAQIALDANQEQEATRATLARQLSELTKTGLPTMGS